MNKRMSWLWRLVTFGVITSLLLAACAQPATAPAGQTTGGEQKPTEAAAPAAAAAQPSNLKEVAREKTLVVMAGGPNQYAQFDNQNPFIPGSDQAFHMGTLPAMYEPLIMFNVLTGKYVNWLAEKWEYNADFTEITLHLRQGVKWDDGQPFGANDVVYSFNMNRDNADKMVHLADLPTYLKEAVKVDDLTVKLVLKKPSPSFWATTLTTNHGPIIVPEHIWKDKNPLEFNNFDLANGLPVGTGPFKLVFASPQQKIYDRRDDWWAIEAGFQPKPNIERIIYLPQQDEAQAAQMMINGDLDMGPIMQVATLKNVLSQNPKVTMFTGQNPPYGYLDWCPIDLNLNDSVAPYDDKEIRWALSYALDREKLVSIAEVGAGVPALHQFTPYEWFKPFDEALKKEVFSKYTYDTAAHLDKVDEIMGKKGWTKNGDGLWADKDGKTFKMNIYVPDWLKAYGPPLSQQLRDAGFDANFDTSPGLDSQVQTGEQKEAFGCKGPSGVLGMDPYFMLSIYGAQYFRPTGEPAPIWWATSRWQNADYDKLVEQIAPLKVDDPQVMGLFTKAMDLWVSEMPDIYVGQLIIRYPMSTKYWTNWPLEGNAYGFPHSWQHDFMLTFINLKPAQ